MANKAKVRNWALVNNKTNIVENLVVWDGEAKVDFGNGLTAVEVPEGAFISTGFTHSNGEFVAPPPTEEEQQQNEEQLIATNAATKQMLFDAATLSISVLQDAVDLEMATEEEAAALTAWKKYRVLLTRVDANTDKDVKWPAKPS
ncbi:tail fiber assembly protein [Pantoea sp. UYEF8]|uniref:tail fiber assembly protein n=1 Tax=Pantoea sp. UYEF8 TaxID=1756394 RepID=UPI0033919BA6